MHSDIGMKAGQAVLGLGAHYMSYIPVCVCVFIPYEIKSTCQSCLIANEVSPFSSPVTPPLHLCITSTVVSTQARLLYFFPFLLPPSLPPFLDSLT